MAHEATLIVGTMVIGKDNEVLLATGKASDSRVRQMATDPSWVAEALTRRVSPILFSDARYTALVTKSDQGIVMLLFEDTPDTVTQFISSVDFAWDIMEHILTDPYDGMVVVDANEKVAFVSPVHERFFGIQSGEAVGKRVRDVIPNSRLHHVVRTGVAEVGQILKLKDSHRVVSRHPIRHDGAIVGAIGRVMFKGPEQVEELAKRVNDLEKKIAQYKAEAEEEERGERFLDAIIGQSLAIESVRQQIRKIAPLDVPVLIQGESGTGKELVAKALHMLSPRHGARLVTVNAAALPANLVESELFGYEAGSFTGADRRGRPGKFELADAGTIFLDEIGDMPIEVQSKLLRVLQDRVVERVGGERPKRVDFRLCSATNHDLEALVEQGRFRLDLFYRISPVRIVLPSLNERLEDIPLLLRHFLQEFSEKYGRPVPDVDLSLPDYLMSRDWPGNIRQLRHEIERAMLFAENGRLSVSNFQHAGQASSYKPRQATVLRAPAAPSQDSGSLKDAVDELERTLIADAMTRFRGNKKRVADHLGISRSYLYKKLDHELHEADEELQ